MNTATQFSAAQLWLVLARAYGSVSAYAERTVADQGLCLSDFMVLEVLLHKGPLTISAIGDKVLLASASMTSAIDRLEERDFVKRTGSEADRRIRLVTLTPSGKTFIRRIFKQHERDLEAVAADLSPDERMLLHDALKKFGLAAETATRERRA